MSFNGGAYTFTAVNIRYALIASLALNVAAAGYIARHRIKSMFPQPVPPAVAKQLQAMNRTPMPAYTEAAVTRPGGQELRLLVVGNSIAYHPVAAELGWRHTAGMAASAESQDYAHQLLRLVAAEYPERTVRLRVSNQATFERGFAGFDLGQLRPLATYRPDLLVVQLGDNTQLPQGAPDSVFVNRYSRLVDVLQDGRRPLTICTTPFFATASVNHAITKAALAQGAYVADLSALGAIDPAAHAAADPRCAADTAVWQSVGVGAHPGDEGMRQIAESIFTIIHASHQK